MEYLLEVSKLSSNTVQELGLAECNISFDRTCITQERKEATVVMNFNESDSRTDCQLFDNAYCLLAYEYVHNKIWVRFITNAKIGNI